MNDLISRSDVLDLLYGIFDKYKMSTDKNTSIGKSFGTDVFEEIRNMPTAYDIGKVVEELEELKNKDICDYLDCDVCLYYKKCEVETDQSNNLKWDKAIEIVKNGDVSDDVCEWKYTKEIMDNAEFKVGCNPNALKRGVVPNNFSYHDFKYCPYCGKKIKVVE